MSLIHNTKHAYIHLQMALNHLSCIDKELGNYANNKLKSLKKETEKTFKALEIELKKSSDMEDIEEMLIKLHEEMENL